MNVTAEIFGACALVMLFLCYQTDDKKKFHIIQIFVNAFFGIQFYLLNTYSAISSKVISIARSLVFCKYESKNRRIPFYILLVFELFTITVGVFTYQNIYSIIPVCITCMYIYGTWQKNLVVTFSIGAIVGILWVIFNYVVGAYTAIIAGVVEFVSSVIGIIRLKRNKISENAK